MTLIGTSIIHLSYPSLLHALSLPLRCHHQYQGPVFLLLSLTFPRLHRLHRLGQRSRPIRHHETHPTIIEVDKKRT